MSKWKILLFYILAFALGALGGTIITVGAWADDTLAEQVSGVREHCSPNAARMCIYTFFVGDVFCIATQRREALREFGWSGGGVGIGMGLSCDFGKAGGENAARK